MTLLKVYRSKAVEDGGVFLLFDYDYGRVNHWLRIDYDLKTEQAMITDIEELEESKAFGNSVEVACADYVVDLEMLFDGAKKYLIDSAGVQSSMFRMLHSPCLKKGKSNFAMTVWQSTVDSKKESARYCYTFSLPLSRCRSEKFYIQAIYDPIQKTLNFEVKEALDVLVASYLPEAICTKWVTEETYEKWLSIFSDYQKISESTKTYFYRQKKVS